MTGERARVQVRLRLSVLRWWQWATMVLGAVRGWVLAVVILPATWRGRDPHRPAEPGSHVYVRHDAYLFRHMLLVRSTARGASSPASEAASYRHANRERWCGAEVGRSSRAPVIRIERRGPCRPHARTELNMLPRLHRLEYGSARRRGARRRCRRQRSRVRWLRPCRSPHHLT
jgi:hypothetical protein